jgi:hypothetical protein
MRGGAREAPAPAIEDEITVDFSDVDQPTAAGDEGDVIDEQAIDWLDDVTVNTKQEELEALDTIRPGELPNEFQLDETNDTQGNMFELDLAETLGHEEQPTPSEESAHVVPTESTLPWEGPKKTLAGKKHKGKKERLAAAGLPADHPGNNPVQSEAVQPFDMKSGFDESAHGKRKKGLVARLIRGIALAVGLVGVICALQLACWWLLRIDPLNVALMVPKSVAWLTPYELTEEGQRAAMQQQVRPTTSAEQPAGETQEGDEPPAESAAPADADLAGTDGSSGDDTEGTARGPVEPSEDDNTDELSTPPADPLPAENVAAAEETGESTDQGVPAEPVPAVAMDTDEVDESTPDAESEETDASDETMAPTDQSTGAEAASLPDSSQDLLNDLGDLESKPADQQVPPEGEETSANGPPAEQESQAPAEPTIEEPAEPPVITNVPVYRAADVREALAAAERATDQLNDAKRQRVEIDKLTQTARDFYTALCQLAETATLVDTDLAQDELSQTRALLASLAQDASKLRMVGTTASGWISRKLGNGVLVAGTIEAVQPVGRFQEVSLRPIGSDESMVIVTSEPDMNAQQSLTVGRNVLLAGYIIRDPELQLPGFLASDPTVVWLRDVIVATP